MYMHGWVGLLSTWNYHNLVNWLYFNRKIENRKTKGFWYNYCPISWVTNWTFLLFYHYLKGLILLFLLNCDSLQILSIIIDWMTNKKKLIREHISPNDRKHIRINIIPLKLECLCNRGHIFFSTEDSIKNDIYKTIYKITAFILHKNTHFNFILNSY